MSDDDIQKIALERARTFRDEAPTTAAQAAKIILDGVKAERWRILVGDDAHRLDERVRKTPEQAYTPEFYQSFTRGGRLAAGVTPGIPAPLTAPWWFHSRCLSDIRRYAGDYSKVYDDIRSVYARIWAYLYRLQATVYV